MGKLFFFNSKLGGFDNFKASAEWQKNFKYYHGIQELTIEDEKQSF